MDQRRFRLELVVAPTDNLDAQNLLAIEVKGSEEWLDTITPHIHKLTKPIGETFRFDETQIRTMDRELSLAAAAARNGQNYAGSIVRTNLMPRGDQ